MSPQELRTATARLVNQVSHWTPSRWGAASGVSGLSRGDVFHALVQRVAHLAAVAEGQPLRSVPRLQNDLALPDQLIVVAEDLARVSPPPGALLEAGAAIADTRAALSG